MRSWNGALLSWTYLWLEEYNNIGSFKPIRTFDRKALGITAAAIAVSTCELYVNFSRRFERKVFENGYVRLYIYFRSKEQKSDI